jgi:hypothetical protein
MNDIRRAHGRILFNNAEPYARFSFCDPARWDGILHDEIGAMTEAKLFTARECLTDYLSLLSGDITTEAAIEKLRLIRRALRTMEIEE